jgi:3-hydroxyanthranilate 3,4-dioxygenase
MCFQVSSFDIITLSMETPVHVHSWIESNKPSFSPPIGNKLMHKNLLSVMFVGGPNSRRDFHVDEASEFFYQLKGNMQLPIIERGKRRIVHIKEGEVFLLPSRIPHSPQRPEEGSVGLVIERSRDIPHEYDCMRWYTDFETCEKIEFEKFFHCRDLGRDLVPVAKEYAEFQQRGRLGETIGSVEKKVIDDTESVVPDAFNLSGFIDSTSEEFRNGCRMSLFPPNHPCRELNISLSSLLSERVSASGYEVFVFQVKGEAVLNQLDTSTGLPNELELAQGTCFVLQSDSEWEIERGLGGITMIVHCNPLGNKI